MSDVLDAARKKECDKFQVRRPLEVLPAGSFSHFERSASRAIRLGHLEWARIRPEQSYRAVASTAHPRRRLSPCSNNCVACRAWCVSTDTTSTSKTGALPCQRAHFPDFSRRRSLATPLSSQNFGVSALMRRHVRRAVCVPEYGQYPQVP